MDILLVKHGAEQFLAAEGARKGVAFSRTTPGILSAPDRVSDTRDYSFPFWILHDAVHLDLQQGTRPVDAACNWFCEKIRVRRIDTAWSLFWLSGNDNGFTPAVSKQEQVRETLKKRISRISKLAESTFPATDVPVFGLFVAESASAGMLYAATAATFCGQHRMKDDPVAPSRSYLKIEEAFSIYGTSPMLRSTVVELGAAPGGWTWAALKRGAKVFAIDNGPLKKGPLDHPDVEHHCSDAFNWKPAVPPVDWLFCDMVQKPQPVVERVRTWFSEGWCRNAVVNFKFGYSDPVEILKMIHGPKGFARYCETLLCRHLFHDRDEITVMAKIKMQ